MGDSPNVTYAAPDNGPMLAMMAQMQSQQAAAQQDAANAQKQAVVSGQDVAAQQAAQTGSNAMQQSLGRMNANQQAMDAAALQKNQQTAGAAGAAVTGGGFDLNNAAAQKATNLGAASSILPSTGANLAGNLPPVKNPAMTTAGANPVNAFTMPAMNGIKFGGV